MKSRERMLVTRFGHLKRKRLRRKKKSLRLQCLLPLLSPCESGVTMYNLTNNRHEWYQTDQYVYVDIFLKNIPKDECVVEIEPHNVISFTIS